MLRSFFAGTALATVILVVMPFVGAPPSDAPARAGVSGGAPVPVISTATVDPDDLSRMSITDLAQRRLGSDADRSDVVEVDADAEVNEPEVEEPATDDDETDEPQTGSGTASGSTGSSSSSSSGSSSGSSAGSAAPAPAAPAPAAPAPAPPAPKPTPSPTPPPCPGPVGGSTPGAPGRTSAQGVGGTTSADLNDFAQRFNAIRVANCLPPVPPSNIRYDSCMEDRLFWMAEDPSPDPMSAWGHKGQAKRSDGVPDTGCDGNLAGGSGVTGAAAAQRWWDSGGHRASLYKPGTSVQGVCILFAMSHGGVPNEPYSFTRAAARWVNC
ncbi:MAG: hypothetical protein ACXIUP_09860 [Microcella sp.]